MPSDTKYRGYEKFHRRFLAFGLGSNFTYFVVKSLCNGFSMGTRMTYEILGRNKVLGIPADHPKNPARIINNLSESFFRTV